MTEDIHSCGYHCDRPLCIKRQRDELVNKYIVEQAEQEAPELSDEELAKLWDTSTGHMSIATVRAMRQFSNAILSRKKDAKREAALQELADIAQENNIGYGDKEFDEMTKRGTEAWKDVPVNFVDDLRGGEDE